jgi:hypothetical protein
MIPFFSGDFGKKRVFVACLGFACERGLEIFCCFTHFRSFPFRLLEKCRGPTDELIGEIPFQ